MSYFTYLFKKIVKSMVIMTALILLLWITLYKLTDFKTISDYFFIGIAVCLFNTWIMNFQKRKFSGRKVGNIIHVSSLWIVMAGIVLVLYHAGFESAAVFAAAVFFASPFLGATLYEGIVGLSLLISLALNMF